MEKSIKKIVNRPFHMASVEIIIPFHGEQAKVATLVENIIASVNTNRYLITLVDDCSVNANFVKDIEKVYAMQHVSPRAKEFLKHGLGMIKGQ